MAHDKPNGSKGWMLASGVLAVIVVAGGAFGLLRYRTAAALTDQVSAATADARQAHQDLDRLKAELSAIQNQARNEQQQLAAVQQQVNSDQQQLHNTEAQLEAESRPDLPIKLTFRSAFLSQGEVAVLQNLSEVSLEVTLDVQSPATGAHIRRLLVINPHAMGQFGPSEGWPFAAGQLVTVSNPRYRPIVLTVKG